MRNLEDNVVKSPKCFAPCCFAVFLKELVKIIARFECKKEIMKKQETMNDSYKYDLTIESCFWPYIKGLPGKLKANVFEKDSNSIWNIWNYRPFWWLISQQRELRFSFRHGLHGLRGGLWLHRSPSGWVSELQLAWISSPLSRGAADSSMLVGLRHKLSRGQHHQKKIPAFCRSQAQLSHNLEHQRKR